MILLERLIGVVHDWLAWIGQHEAKVLLLFLILFGCILGFIWIADEVAEGSTMKFDEWAIRALRRADDPSQPIGPRWLWEVGRDITALGGIAFLTLLTVTVAGFLAIRGKYHALVFIVAATSSALIGSLLLKHSFHRPRPDLVPHLSHAYTSSFPSGHAMLSATVYLTLGALLGRFFRNRALKAYFLIVAGMLTFLVGVSRVYMGVHFPTDVLAGWIAGLTWALASWLIVRALQNKRAISKV